MHGPGRQAVPVRRQPDRAREAVQLLPVRCPSTQGTAGTEAEPIMSADTITIAWENNVGERCELDLDLRDAARLQAGESIAWHGDSPRRWTLGDRIAALQARQDQIEARMRELADEHPGLA
jgi:hypothetical protein